MTSQRSLAALILAGAIVPGLNATAFAQDYGQPPVLDGRAYSMKDPIPAPPDVFIPPPPPPPQPNWQVGLRYWHSEGKTSFTANAYQLNLDSMALEENAYVTPSTSETYDNLTGNTIEFYFRAESETQTFFKGFVGGGWMNGGELDETQFTVDNPDIFSATSDVDDGSLLYTTLDLGKRFNLRNRGPQIELSPFIGFNYWQESGDVYGQDCGPCGETGFIPSSVSVGSFEQRWASLRLGAEAKVRFFDRLTLVGDAAILPVAYLWGDDTHDYPDGLAIPADLDLDGATTSMDISGTGWGYQLEAAAQFDITPNWTIGSGVRYWYASTDGSADYLDFGDTSMKEFESRRFGVYADMSYKFSTF